MLILLMFLQRIYMLYTGVKDLLATQILINTLASSYFCFRG